MRELSVAEQRYQAVLAVIADGSSILQVAQKVGVSRQTLHAWLARYAAAALEGLVDRSHRPVSCPHQMPATVEAMVLELRRSRPYWGPRRLAFELDKRGVRPVPSESAAYRALVRAGMIDPSLRDPLCSRSKDRARPAQACGARASGNGGNAVLRWSCGRWSRQVELMW